MNRKEFLKKLGLGALVIAIAPKVLAEKTTPAFNIGLIEKRLVELKDKDYHLLTVSRTPDREDIFKDGDWHSRTFRCSVKREDHKFYKSVYKHTL